MSTEAISEEQFLREFTKELHSRNAAAFIGAGFSMSAGYVNWQELLKGVVTDLGLDPKKEHDLVSVAQYSVNKAGGNRNGLTRTILHNIGLAKKPTRGHSILADLPIHTFWTTNYDKLIETSLEAAKKVPDVKHTIELIKNKSGGDGTKVINLIKSIERLAEENSDDPFLIAMAERTRAVQEKFESRQTSTAEALAELLRELESNETRKKEQAEKSFDGLTYFIYRSLLDAKIQNAEAVSQKIRQAFTEFPNWKRSENAIRELRKKVTFAIFAETDNLDQVTAMVDELFKLLEKASRI